MRHPFRKLRLRSIAPSVFGVSLALGLLTAAPAADDATDKVDFNRQVRPILAQYCFKCHGPDDKQREAGLRLDVREAALAPAESGERAIVPGQSGKSQVVARIEATDPDQVMPPPTTKKQMTPAEKATLKKWIEQGAEYQPHWAFVAPRQAPAPAVKQRNWPQSPLDPYVLARIERGGLHPSPPADRFTLVRRVYLDLLGVPPTPDEADAFVNDANPDALERLVDRLLASPAYGERWARRWLDLARYADTNGYEKDRPRSIWPYREWVIQALNTDLPFDQFTIEQLAGDMLPNATESQRIATGFHRNTMINEEGGIDPLEFRFHAMVDRMNTTGTVWLGLTLGCAYCHTHKFDPIPQTEYYGMFEMMNNADEPEMDVQLPDIARRRAQLEAQIADLEKDLPNRFPPEGDLRWTTPTVVSVQAASGATIERLEDGSLLVTGTNPEVDTYTVQLDSDATDVSTLKLETLTHPSLGNQGPGRTAHGNFVLTDIAVRVAARAKPDDAQPVKIATATAEIEQDMFPVVNAFDDNAKSGWAIHNPSKPLNENRAATFTLERPVGQSGGSRWTIVLQQQHGAKHTIGRWRIQLGQLVQDSRPLEARRREHRDKKFAAWLESQSARAVQWTTLRPVTATSNLPLLTILDDNSIYASGDQSKSDLYELLFRNVPRGITAVRIEALPDDRLPKHGPGRVYYEGPHGDFFLSDIRLLAGPEGANVAAELSPLREFPFGRASESFASGGNKALSAIDDNKQTGWAINGGQGKPHTAVFNLKEPLAENGTLVLRLLFERYYAAGLGRLRISVTTDPRAEALALPPDVEQLLAIAAAKRTSAQSANLLAEFLATAPELASERQKIEQLRNQLPGYPTTLVFQERPRENPRPTFRHHRGEFLQPKEKVEPTVLSILPGLPRDAERNRLSFARWLVDPTNPLVGRVTMNRRWAALFGRGIVRTTEDFGYQGESPSNPELLDWLAVELPRQGWSLKRLDRILVTSATYRQASRAEPELLARDPHNELLARGPRVRLEAELIRDLLLQTSGMLTVRLGGPSVFPPQPANVTTEGAYGALSWRVSDGADRYRRGLYTFAKRTAPYAMFTTFDAPSGEACVARRELSNTPLQALTLMNDPVFLEAAQTLGEQLSRSTPAAADVAGDPTKLECWRSEQLYRRCLTRHPTAEELDLVVRFYRQQKQRFVDRALDPTTLAGAGAGEPAERAAWTATARVLLNLDETITKN